MTHTLQNLHEDRVSGNKVHWEYNFYVNPFSSRAADIFHYFAYIISATITLDTLHIERYDWHGNRTSLTLCTK